MEEFECIMLQMCYVILLNICLDALFFLIFPPILLKFYIHHFLGQCIFLYIIAFYLYISMF